MQSEFHVAVRKEDGATVIVIGGELDLASAPRLQEEVQAGLSSEAETLVIDLRELDFMDSTGLSVLVRAHQAAEDAGRRLVLIQGPAQVQRLLSLTGVAERLTVVDSPEDALGGG